MATCQCEQLTCQDHGNKCCIDPATVLVATTYGQFKMCRACADEMASTRFYLASVPLESDDEPDWNPGATRYAAQYAHACGYYD